MVFRKMGLDYYLGLCLLSDAITTLKIYIGKKVLIPIRDFSFILLKLKREELIKSLTQRTEITILCSLKNNVNHSLFFEEQVAPRTTLLLLIVL